MQTTPNQPETTFRILIFEKRKRLTKLQFSLDAFLKLKDPTGTVNLIFETA